MYHAVESDFDRVYEIFKLHREWFPHVRTDKLKRQIERKQLIIENDVVITYKYYKVKTKIGKEVQALPNDCILHQIVAKKPGTASVVLQKFFKYTKRKVFLSVRRDNNIASKFYLKNDLSLFLGLFVLIILKASLAINSGSEPLSTCSFINLSALE